MEKLALSLVGIYIFKIIYEKISLNKKRKTIKNIIHVNGIRGKSTTTRLIDAGLREEGVKVFSKITGTAPKIIDENNLELPIVRRGKANIREQIKIIKKVSSLNLDYLVLECMAVNPVYQKICEEKIVRANIGVITNVREDHLDEMGPTLDDIAASLSQMIPRDGVLFTADKKYYEFFKEEGHKKNTKVILASNFKEEYSSIDFPENVALALEICKYMGMKEKEVLHRMKLYKKDSGVLREIKFRNRLNNEISFINAMAANDPDSTKNIIDSFKEKDIWQRDKYLMVNNRRDRLSRMEQFVRFTDENHKDFKKIFISGEACEVFYKELKSKGLSYKIEIINSLENMDKLENDSLIFAVGNICGKGKEIVEKIEAREGK